MGAVNKLHVETHIGHIRKVHDCYRNLLLVFFLKNVELFVVNIFSKNVQEWFTCTSLSIWIKHFVSAEILFLSLGMLIFFTCKEYIKFNRIAIRYLLGNKVMNTFLLFKLFCK